MADPREDRGRRRRDGPRYPFVVKAREVALGTSTAHETDHVHATLIECFQGAHDLGRCRLSLHGGLDEQDLEAVTGLQ